YNPHDRFEMNENSKVRFLKGDLLHYSYHTLRQHINQANHFAYVGAKTAYSRGKRSNTLLIILKPTWKFFRDFFLKLGILDGYYGFVISIISAHATFLKYIRLREIQKSGNEQK
ncbi:MAG: hypothetical protein PVF73_08855, partial [Bacteroidales bacterium]